MEQAGNLLNHQPALQKPRSICLISPSHPCSNPRLVKEADALAEAGYRVHVITCRYMPSLDKFDDEIYRQAKWTYFRVDQTAPFRKIRRLVLKKLALSNQWIAERWPLLLHHPASVDLFRPAQACRADLYIAHVLAGLPAACRAAARNGAKAGFDAEDYHGGEIEESPENLRDIFARRQLEKLMIRCTHLTAASPQITARYKAENGLDFVAVLNAFPTSMFPERKSPPPSPDGSVRLYWFSQTIGPDRGLEEIAAILNLLRTPVTLSLRGHAQPAFVDGLRSACRFPIHILPPAPPSSMAECFADQDVGLALEMSTPPNRDICLTNKLFVSLLAGRPLILSRTSAQTGFARELGDAAVLIDFANPAQSARALDEWLGNPARLQRASDAAWTLGRTRFNWDTEKHKFLDAVAASLRQ